MRPVKDILDEHFSLRPFAVESSVRLQEAASLITSCLKANGKVLICGNGGSAADSQHFAAELVGRFQKERHGLPALALTTDSSILTSVANDYGFDHVFERSVEALSSRGDVLVAISTSGNSINVLNAVAKAKAIGLKTVSLLGKDGGLLKDKADIELLVSYKNTARVQEMHILFIHAICELVEDSF
jgi:D-sedoheptulose 7-phosphate isomerase